MNTTTNTLANSTSLTPAGAAATPEAKPVNVLGNMASRRLFDNSAEALAYIEKCQTDYADFDDFPIAAVGLVADENGVPVMDPEIYTEEMRIAVAVLTQRGEEVGAKSTVRAIVVYPAPKLEAILASDTGTAWVNSIIEKELNHVAVRNLRKPDAVSEAGFLEAVDSMPQSIADFITANRETSGGILETYNGLWQLIKKGIGLKFKAFAAANLSKKELRKGIESASYAMQTYPKLEGRQNKAGEPDSLFAKAAEFGIMIAKSEGLDPAFFERALANRDETVIDSQDDEADDFDMEALAAQMTAKPGETPATDAPTGEPAPDADNEGTDGTGEQ